MTKKNAARQIDRTLFSHTISHDEFLGVLEAVALFAVGREGAGDVADNEVTWGLPVLLWDEPGTGKSTLSNKLGKTWLDRTHLHMLSQHPAEDLGGYAVPNKTRDAIDQIPASFVKDLNEADSGLLILDEFGSVDEAKMAAAQSVLSERLAGGTRIKGHVRMLAIGNPPEVATNGVPQSMPSANRFFHMPFIAAEKEGFKSWLLTAGKLQTKVAKRDRAKHEAMVLEAWPAAFAQEASIVCGYLDRFEGDLHSMPEGYGKDDDGGEQDEIRWCSRRVWEMLTRAMASGRIHGLNAIQIDFIVRSILPEGVASRFIAYRNDQDIPTPQEVLDDPEGYKVTNRIDKTIAVLGMTVGYLADEGVADRKQRAVNWWKLADRVIESKYGGADLVKPFARQMSLPTAKGGLGLDHEAVPEAGPVVKKLYNVLTVAKQTKKAMKAGK